MIMQDQDVKPGSDPSAKPMNEDENAGYLDHLDPDNVPRDQERKTASEGRDEDVKQRDEEPKSLLEVVKKTMEREDGESKSEEKSSSSEVKSEPEGDEPRNKSKDKGEKTDGQETDDEPEPEDEGQFTSEPPKTRKRIQRLLKKKHELTGRVETLTTRIETLKPGHEWAEGFRRRMGQLELSGKDLEAGIAMVHAMRYEPDKFLDMVAPIVTSAARLTGRVLPDDLRQEVEDGKMTEERARETARLRYRENRGRQQAERRDEQDRETRERQSRQQVVDDTVKAVSDLEDQWKASDPDYAAKATRVMEKFELEVSRLGRVLKVEEAVEIARKAKKAIDEEMKPLAPRRERIRPKPPGGARPRTEDEPNDYIAAVRSGYAARS